MDCGIDVNFCVEFAISGSTQAYLMAEVCFAAPVVNLCTSGSCLEMKMCKYLTLRLLPAEPDLAFLKHQCCAACVLLLGVALAAACALRQMEEDMGANREPK